MPSDRQISRESVPRKGLKVVTVGVGAVLLSGCAANTIEGVATRECVRTDATYTLEPGNSIYLGDLSSHDGPLRGPREDWFEVRNQQGAIHYEQEDFDNGKVRPAEDGFVYTENGKTYHVTYQNSPNNITAPIDVRVQTTCKNDN